MKRQPYKRSPRTIPGSSEDIFSYLDAHGVYDKDRTAPPPAKSPKQPIEKRKGGIRRMTLDLHGSTSDEASRRIRSTIEWCRGHGVGELLVIHGIGRHSAPAEGPVLKNLLHDLLDYELKSTVRGFRAGLPREGGEGATVIYLA